MCEPYDDECINYYNERINQYVIATVVFVGLTCCLCILYCIAHKRRETQEKVQKNPKSKADLAISKSKSDSDESDPFDGIDRDKE